MAKVRIEFKSDGFQRVLNSPGTEAAVAAQAARIASAAGTETKVRKFRAGYGGSPRPAAAVRTVAKTAEEAYAARKALKGAV